MRSRHKKWAAPYIESHRGVIAKDFDVSDPFFKAERLYLEVGSGKGDFAIGMSSRLGGSYVAIERDESIAATMAKRIEGLDLNIKIFQSDFDDVYEKIKNLKFEAIYLNFSDPWPKKKQGKRRLTSANRLEMFYSLLKDGGELFFKTDSDILFESTLENVGESKFLLSSVDENYTFDSSDDIMSEYEKKARNNNLKIHRLILKKKGKE